MSSRLTGKVKWFVDDPGCGIIISDDTGEEVLVQQSSIKSDGCRRLVVGETVEFGIEHGNDGWINAVEVTRPNGANVQGKSCGEGRTRDGGDGGGERGGDGADKMSSRSTGKVKWFVDDPGCGIIISDETGEEVLVQQSSIKSDGCRSLVVGETVEFEIEHGNDGWINAVEVTRPDGANVKGKSCGEGRPRDGGDGGGERGGDGADKMSSRSTGKVKCFVDDPGCGITISDETGEEVLVQQSSIKSDGCRSLVVGETVEFEIEHGNDGWINTVEVTRPNGPNVEGSLRESCGVGRPCDGGYGGGGTSKVSSRLTGQVTWFLDDPLVGIITSDESGEEVLIKQSSSKFVCCRCRVDGETVEFKIKPGYGRAKAAEVTVQGILGESCGVGRDGGYGGGGASKISSRLTGKVKWFLDDPVVGIIVSDESGEEVLIKQSSSKFVGCRCRFDGEMVEFEIKPGYRWSNAVEVIVEGSLGESYWGGGSYGGGSCGECGWGRSEGAYGDGWGAGGYGGRYFTRHN